MSSILASREKFKLTLCTAASYWKTFSEKKNLVYYWFKYGLLCNDFDVFAHNYEFYVIFIILVFYSEQQGSGSDL